MENFVKLESKLYAMLAYLGPLSIWSAFHAKEDEFIRYHAKRGLVLFILEALIWTISALPVIGIVFTVLARLVFGLLSVFGMISALAGETGRLMGIDSLAEKFVL